MNVLHKREGILIFNAVSRKAFVIPCLSKRWTFEAKLPRSVLFFMKITVSRSTSLSRREMSIFVSRRPVKEYK